MSFYDFFGHLCAKLSGFHKETHGDTWYGDPQRSYIKGAETTRQHQRGRMAPRKERNVMSALRQMLILASVSVA